MSLTPASVKATGPSGAPRRLEPRQRRKLSKNTVNFILDAVLLLVFLVVLWLTAVLQVVFPPIAEMAGYSLWGFGFDAWRAMLAASIAALAFLVLIHLILHWSWISGFVASRASRLIGRRLIVREPAKTIYGVITLIAILTLLVGLIGAAMFAIQGPAGGT